MYLLLTVTGKEARARVRLRSRIEMIEEEEGDGGGERGRVGGRSMREREEREGASEMPERKEATLPNTYPPHPTHKHPRIPGGDLQKHTKIPKTERGESKGGNEGYVQGEEGDEGFGRQGGPHTETVEKEEGGKTEREVHSLPLLLSHQAPAPHPSSTHEEITPQRRALAGPHLLLCIHMQTVIQRERESEREREGTKKKSK